MNQKVERGLRYFPIALFASVMGISGVTISLKLFENMWEIGHGISTTFLIFASLLFLINAIILLHRLIRFKEDVKKDFNHPVRMNFFAAISISLLLLSVPYYEINELLSFYLWIAGAVLQLIFTLFILTKVIWKHTFEVPQFNPAWFIPIVGNLVVPLAGVYHAGVDINWLFFSLGIFFSIVYITLFLYRMFFHPVLPPKLRPTFYILLAPPGVGMVSYLKLVGELDSFAYILFGIAFYIGLLLLFQFKRFFTIPFFISWWAYLFPSAAVTNATYFMYAETGKVYYSWLFQLQVAGLLVLVVYLLWKTIQLAINKSLCLKEE
ncbi:SLAC1 anion channel family protein [Fervidibacillus halotolerans]|uniref:SLAC1 anion channel family protein n=1 Tax=Fervidibacillus halotolerans TaxID=2980027 RepID=A0A9E8LYT5_9BACI|nr:SLAC1 anion channel family protein [Fervidibacillus halotolerans]WAA12079.1 SLAC1 anion channel family protein [Fervidibacillus halotolerans]